MSIERSIQELSKHFSVMKRGRFGTEFVMDGYSVAFYPRGRDDLVISFAAVQQEKWRKPAVRRPGWGKDFLAKREISAMHVKADKNTWYRGPDLELFFKRAKDSRLFSHFPNIMTYGASMGGFGALSFAGLAGANVCLAYAPQVHLGPSTLEWEPRYSEARDSSWDGDLCDINKQLMDVRFPVVIFDPYHRNDRRHAEMINVDQVRFLKVPFVGHHVPEHLKSMGMLSWVFDQCLKGAIDENEFYRRVRSRRSLLRFRNTLLNHAERSPARTAIINKFMSPENLVGRA